MQPSKHAPPARREKPRPAPPPPLVLGAIPTTSRTARAITRALLAGLGRPDLADTAELVTSELVTNAVRASAQHPDPPPVLFRVTLTPQASALIEVWDSDPRQPVIFDVSPHDERGRGLALVDALSLAWGWAPVPAGGKVTWAEVTSG